MSTEAEIDGSAMEYKWHNGTVESNVASNSNPVHDGNEEQAEAQAWAVAGAVTILVTEPNLRPPLRAKLE